MKKNNAFLVSKVQFFLDFFCLSQWDERLNLQIMTRMSEKLTKGKKEYKLDIYFLNICFSEFFQSLVHICTFLNFFIEKNKKIYKNYTKELIKEKYY